MKKENADLGLDGEEGIDDDGSSVSDEDEIASANKTAFANEAAISSALDDFSLEEPSEIEPTLDHNNSTQLQPHLSSPTQMTHVSPAPSSHEQPQESEGDDPLPSTVNSGAPKVPVDQISKKDKRRAREAAKKEREAEGVSNESSSQVRSFTLTRVSQAHILNYGTD